MRIVYIAPYPPARDGIGDYTAALARAVRARGHEVGIVAARSAGAAPGGEVMAVVPAAPRADAAALRAIAAFSPDVIHLQFAVAAFGGRTAGLIWLLRRLGDGTAPIVITLHEVTRDTHTLRGPGRRLYRAVARLADVAVVHNERSAEVLRAIEPGRPVVVVPHPRAELPPPSTTPAALRERLALGERRVLMAFGFVHVDKGLDVLVEALHELRCRGRRDVHLVVAGAVRPRHGLLKVFQWRDDLHLRAVRRAIARHGLEGHVTFTGYVPSGEIGPYLRLGDAVVLPYRRIEDSGVANLALAAGASMVVSDAGVLPEYVPDPARRVPPGDVGALARALERVLDGDLGATAGAAGGGADLATVVEHTLALYAEATRGAGP